VAKQRSTFGKLDRERAKQAKATAKQQRRAARGLEGVDHPPPSTPRSGDEHHILRQFAELQAAFDDGRIGLEDFESRRNQLRDRLHLD
jgi:hypothetical protein